MVSNSICCCCCQSCCHVFRPKVERRRQVKPFSHYVTTAITFLFGNLAFSSLFCDSAGNGNGSTFRFRSWWLLQTSKHFGLDFFFLLKEMHSVDPVRFGLKGTSSITFEFLFLESCNRAARAKLKSLSRNSIMISRRFKPLTRTTSPSVKHSCRLLQLASQSEAGKLSKPVFNRSNLSSLGAV